MIAVQPFDVVKRSPVHTTCSVSVRDTAVPTSQPDAPLCPDKRRTPFAAYCPSSVRGVVVTRPGSARVRAKIEPYMLRLFFEQVWFYLPLSNVRQSSSVTGDGSVAADRGTPSSGSLPRQTVHP